MSRINSGFRPMLAPNDDPMKNKDYFKLLRFPLLVSPKLDGIRCITKEGSCKSRSFIDLPSEQVQSIFSKFQELDGEIIAGDETDFEVYNRTQSHVMSKDKPSDDIKFRVFDCADERLANMPFQARLDDARIMIRDYKDAGFVGQVSLVEHVLCRGLDELLAEEERQLELGYEGVMMRDPLGRYKHNRGTFKEGLIYKLKRFEDVEAKVVGFEEGLHNANEDVRSNLGGAKRSTAKAGMELAGTLGKVLVDYHGTVLRVACGVLTHVERYYIWTHQEEFLGRMCRFRHFPHGMKDLPRFPRFVGWWP